MSCGFLFASLSTASAQSPSAGAFHPGEPVWRIGAITRKVDALNVENWFGGVWHTARGAELRGACSGASIEASVLYRGEMELEDLRFVVDKVGAQVQIKRDSDIWLGDLEDVGGLCCILTDENSAAIDFELYEIRESGFVELSAGHIKLSGTPSEAITNCLANAATSQSDKLVMLANGTAVARGYVDALGRKQGRWTVSKAGAKRCEMGWRNGILDGNFLQWDSSQRLLGLCQYSGGLREGEELRWSDSGDLQSKAWLVEDRWNGTRTVFHPGGAKALEVLEENGRTTSLRRVWSKEGSLLEGPTYSDLLVDGPQEPRWRGKEIERFRALQTRPR